MRSGLASRPQIIFADEPTGNLDSVTGTEILSFMRNAVREFGQTIVMVTHDPVAASYADRVVFVGDGKLAGELLNPTTTIRAARRRQRRGDRAARWPDVRCVLGGRQRPPRRDGQGGPRPRRTR